MSAVLSPCGRYRYSLTREFFMGAGRVLFVMLNPSTADAETDDPTIRRCIGFARRWGFRRLDVGNLFAWRATNPKEIRQVSDPVGPENDRRLMYLSECADAVIAAWGTHGAYRNRDSDVLALLAGKVEHLGLTKQGHPKHPLYLRNDVARVGWSH
ncbi:hypothetical protein LCGC14_1343720 [marine sediment metagenome]|uniref:DUF1643 domain-containing protein n=1 Tax=marine sediment metagenome TaxID=412755 RepID=A0A0F9NFA9_9ZZZZ